MTVVADGFPLASTVLAAAGRDPESACELGCQHYPLTQASEFYRWGSICTGAATKETRRGRMRHLAYAGGWKKFEPLLDIVIRSRRADGRTAITSHRRQYSKRHARPSSEGRIAVNLHATSQLSPRRAIGGVSLYYAYTGC